MSYILDVKEVKMPNFLKEGIQTSILSPESPEKNKERAYEKMAALNRFIESGFGMQSLQNKLTCENIQDCCRTGKEEVFINFILVVKDRVKDKDALENALCKNNIDLYTALTSVMSSYMNLEVKVSGWKGIGKMAYMVSFVVPRANDIANKQIIAYEDVYESAENKSLLSMTTIEYTEDILFKKAEEEFYIKLQEELF